MGCFDVYCLICNNATNSARILEDYFEDTNNERLEHGKTVFNIDDINTFVNKTRHLNKCTFLTEKNKIVHNCCEISGCGTFKDNDDNLYELFLHKDNEDENMEYGIFLHTSCWQYIKNKFNIELSFSDIKSNIINDLSDNLFVKIDHNDIIDEYIEGQYMDFEKLFEDKNLYLCYSPLDFDEKNNKRIDKVIEQVIIL
jgi:hypothetical protein